MLMQGMAYVPGCVCGVLRRGSRPSSADDILLITQADIPKLNGRPAGVVVLDGAPFSHCMIGLLGLGVPTIAIPAPAVQALSDGMPVMLNGGEGVLSSAEAGVDVPAEPEPPSAGDPVFTADGVPVYLCASVRSLSAAHAAASCGAASIGLVRSEFLTPDDGSRPAEAFYLQAFADLCEAASPLKVTIRLLDAAVDKRPAWLPEIAGFGAILGLQGARLFGDAAIHKVVQAQLLAMARLAADYDLEVLIPYLVRREELHHWVGQFRPLLPPGVPLGAMIETPAAALDIGRWFDDADFITVGCNDLMQCLFAADRDSPAVSRYLDPYAPLLYRLLQQIADNAGGHLEKVRLCGVLPQLRGVLPILLGLGFRRFSVDAVHIPYLAQTIRTSTISTVQMQAHAVCHASDSTQVLAALNLPDSDYRPYIT